MDQRVVLSKSSSSGSRVNLGVEIGQIAIASAVLPIVWQLRRRESFVRVGVPLLSAVVALAGLYWLVERTI